MYRTTGIGMGSCLVDDNEWGSTIPEKYSALGENNLEQRQYINDINSYYLWVMK